MSTSRIDDLPAVTQRACLMPALEHTRHQMAFDDPLKCDVTRYHLSSQQMTASDALVCLRNLLQTEPAIFEMPSPSLFLNSAWIEAWLQSLPADFPIIVQSATFEASENYWNGRLCALAFFGWEQQRAWLHRTGLEMLDQVWIEYNRFFFHPRVHDGVIPALIQMLFSHHHALSVHVSIYEINRENTRHIKLYSRFCWLDITHQESGHFVPLGQVSPELHWSSSLRRSIRSTEKYATEKQWDLIPCSPEESWAYLEQASSFHIEKWQGTSTPSGFTNQHFRQFHQTLLCDHPERVLLFRVQAKQEIIAVIYLLRAQKTLGFYLGCYADKFPAKVKLGLWAHAKIMAWATAHGYTEYDFMAGDARYKAEFSPHRRQYIALSLHKRTFKSALYLTAVSLRHQWRKWTSKFKLSRQFH